MSEIDQAEHVVAEEFEPLIAAGAIARPGQRRNVGQRLLEQCRILEAIADALLELAVAPAALALAELGSAHRPAAGPPARRGACSGSAPRSLTLLPLAAAHRTIVNNRLQRSATASARPARRRALANREEDDLGTADNVLERHIADLARARGCRSNCRGCRPS